MNWASIIGQIEPGAVLLGLALLWQRLEHRLTRLEDKVDCIEHRGAPTLPEEAPAKIRVMRSQVPRHYPPP